MDGRWSSGWWHSPYSLVLAILTLPLLEPYNLQMDRSPRRTAIIGAAAVSLRCARQGPTGRPTAAPTAHANIRRLRRLRLRTWGRIERAWVAHTGDLPKSEAARELYGAKTTPLKIDDTHHRGHVGWAPDCCRCARWSTVPRIRRARAGRHHRRNGRNPRIGLDYIAADHRAGRDRDGSSGTRRPERDAPSGVIQGYDAVTGTREWAWI